MVDSDVIKASTKLETVNFSELKHTALEALVEFIYIEGSKLSEKEKQHVRSTPYVAAGKYEVLHLRDLCRIQLLENCRINSANAFKLLDFSQIPFDMALNDAVFGYIKENIGKVSSHPKVKDFVVKYPNLIVEILKTTVCTRCGIH